MQGSIPPYVPSYESSIVQQFHGHPAAKATVDPAAIPTPALKLQAEGDALISSETDAHGQVCAVQLPVGLATPTRTAWCSISNLVAVALNSEPACSTAQILVLEPSSPEEYTTLELPLSGPGDYVTSLEWSWPGQRRALLSATASGRVAVWTQPSQQGQDDSVLPRCVDDWQGQLLLDLEPVSSSNPRGGPNAVPGANHHPHQHTPQRGDHVKHDPGARQGGGGGGAAHVKPEPGVDSSSGAEPRIGSPGGVPQSPSLRQQQQQQAQQMLQPLIATACWLRQPGGGRVWSTSSLALKRLEGHPTAQQQQQGGEGRGGGANGGGAPGGPLESFDTVFCDEDAAAGAVPHWARPHQLTAAVLTTSGSLTILWSQASKLPNTLSWQRSKSLRIPQPPQADTADGGVDADWRIVSASMCAVQDGSLAVAVVYDKRRDAVYLYGVRGNPTLAGQPVASQPGAPLTAAVTAAVAAAGREAPAPTVALMALLSLPKGLTVRQCQLHVSGSNGASRRAFVLAQPVFAVATAAAAPYGWPAAAAAPAAAPPPHSQPSVVLSFADSADDGVWRLERTSSQLEPYGSNTAAEAAAVAAAASASSAGSAGPAMSVSVEGSKMVVTLGSLAYSLDAETLTVLAVHDVGRVLPFTDEAGAATDSAQQPATPNPTQRSVLASAAALSSNSCCVCAVARVAAPPHAPLPGARRKTDEGDGDGWGECMDDEDDYDDGGGGGGGGSADVVVLSIRTVPDVVPPPSVSGVAAPGAGGAAGAAASGRGAAALEGVADAIACNLDTLRLAWGLLHRVSLWDVAERLRATWMAGRHEHVSRSLAQLDGLLYGHEDHSMRVMLASLVSRAKLEVLRRLPHPQASLLAADLLAAGRILQYCQSLHLIGAQQAEALANEEIRAIAAHMIWFIAECHTLMLASLKLWAESLSAADGGPPAPGGTAARALEAAGDGESGAEAGADPSAADLSMLPLMRLMPDYPLSKYSQLPLFAGLPSRDQGKPAEARSNAGLVGNPAILELLGGSEFSNRMRMVVSACKTVSQKAMAAMTEHLKALQLQQQEGLVPGVPALPMTTTEVEIAAKSGDLPRALMQRTLPCIFPGPFHFHYGRCKGVITQQLIAQWFRSEEVARVSSHISLSRDAIMERYRALGLQAALTDRRHAPHLASRKLWMSFRAPAPAPEVHSHVLTQHVSVRQRQRWRRQRAAALALSNSAPLWSHVQGSLVDCLTGVPLPPGTPWSLEGASAVGAVTSQMGPGAARRNLPPFLAAVQRAWVGCAPPAELGSLWKRARLGLEQDMEY